MQTINNSSTLPIVLTRTPRHYTKTGRWVLEFHLEEHQKKKAQEKAAARLLIIGTALERTERNRMELKQRSTTNVRLEGLEDFLRELNRLAIICLAADKTGAVSGLAVRALHDFILAVEGTLAGEHVTVFESMRDVMEIELLLREFQNERHRIREWIESDNDALKRKFTPGVLRQLHANRLGVKPQDLPEHFEYQAHSIGVHVTPSAGIPPFGSRDMITDCSDPFAVEGCFWDIFAHARSFLGRLIEFLDSDSLRDLDKNPRLGKFVRASADIKKSQELYYGILEAIDRRLQEIPVTVELPLEIEIDVVPPEYKDVFVDLCAGRLLKARVLFNEAGSAELRAPNTQSK
jgi:hypothetical protein